jgi:hypothetical protein
LELLRSCHWSTRCSPSFPILIEICILLLKCIRNNSHKLPPCVIHLFQQTKLKERVNTLFGIDFPSRMSIESSIICRRQCRRDRTWVHCWACGNSPVKPHRDFVCFACYISGSHFSLCFIHAQNHLTSVMRSFTAIVVSALAVTHLFLLGARTESHQVTVAYPYIFSPFITTNIP